MKRKKQQQTQKEDVSKWNKPLRCGRVAIAFLSIKKNKMKTASAIATYDRIA